MAGYARRPETRKRAREIGAVDVAPDCLAEAVQADVIVLAAPVLAIRRLLQEIAPHVPDGTVVTDVASTKRDVERWALRFLPRRIHFVGGHPMAGKETAGIEHADGALFHDRTWCVIPPPGADDGAVELVTRIAAATGARTVQMSAEEHDRAVAATSHLAFAVSKTLCRSVIAGDDFGQRRPVAGTGLRDTTRLASGDALMHRDICLTNRDNLVRELEHFSARLAELTGAIRQLPDPDDAEGDPALQQLEDLFVSLKQARDSWLSER
ncbi:MAG: prephenate dehydrogenase [Chloroflexi bacterium]|nr:prephenate dehydrogenase [Chloroflexota bacterium]